MPVFTSIGLALGLTGGAAFVGGAAVVGAAAYGAYALGSSVASSGKSSSVDSRISSATGALTPAEAQTAAKKRAFRSGVLFTSPTGLDSDVSTSSVKLK